MQDEDFLPASAFQNSPSAILISDAGHGKVVATNQTFFRLFGFEREEVLGNVSDNLGIWPSPEERQKLTRALDAAPSFSSLELVLCHRSGRRIMTSCSGNRATYRGEACNVLVIVDLSDRMELRNQITQAAMNFRNIFDNSPILMAISELTTGKFLDCNRAFAVVTGYPREAIVGAVAFELGIWDDLATRRKVMEGLGMNQSYSGVELRFWHKSGAELWGRCSFSKVQYDGKDCMLSSIEDITQERSLAASIQEQNALLEYVIENLDDPIFVKDLEGRYVICNSAGARIIRGMERSQVVGRVHSDLVPPDIAKELGRQDTLVISTGETHTFDQEFIVDGKVTVVQAKKAPWRDTAGNIIGVMGIARDITARKEFEETLRRQNEMKNKLLTILAHDLRGPVGNVSTLLGLILDHPQSIDDTRELIEETHKSSLQTFDLLENLLNWIRGQMSETSPQRAPVDLFYLAEHVGNWLSAQARLKGVRIDVQVPESVRVFTDDRMLETVLRNLVSNAIKYSNPGGTITIAASISDSSVVVRVIDHGKGMSSQTLASLFGTTKVSSVVGTRGERGNGLGLLFCNDLVLSIGGRLEAESELGVGSTFCLTLPAMTGEAL